jgi:hypothetical protein
MKRFVVLAKAEPISNTLNVKMGPGVRQDDGPRQH